MNSRLAIICLLCSFVGTAWGSPAGRPNVIVILADDLGFSDIGCYGGEIKTPNLDRLANNGLRYSQFYNTARCWPTRAAFLTGYYAQQVRRDAVPGILSGSRGVRPSWAQVIPAMLKPSGYRSYHSGKWHVDGMPVEAGFDRSYRLADHGRFFSPRDHFVDDKSLPPVEPGSGYYATTAIADHAIECLTDHAARHADRPFFHFVAFTSPHFPLHALPEDIAKYEGVYDVGWEEIRNQRWQRLARLGIVNGKLSDVERNIGSPHPGHYAKAIEALGEGEVDRPFRWEQLTEAQRKFQATKMCIHAAMVDRMDQEIGRVLKQIERMGEWENTLILFFSDNGATAEILVRDDGHDRAASPGSAATHLCLGPGWSTVSNTPFRRHKMWTHEGGIATPLIAHWPDRIQAKSELRHDVGHVVDLVPTLLEIATGQPTVASTESQQPQRPGSSLLSTFSEDENLSPRTLWWCHGGNRAIRVGNWKLVSWGKGSEWELYDLATDRTETNDLAAQHPDRVHQLALQWTDLYEAHCRDAKVGL